MPIITSSIIIVFRTYLRVNKDQNMDQKFQNQQRSNNTYMDFKVPGGVNNVKHRHPQKSKTLMRSSVKNPKSFSNTISGLSTPLSPNPVLSEIDTSKPEPTKLDGYIHNRHPRNYKIPRSELISRFSSTSQSLTPEESTATASVSSSDSTSNNNQPTIIAPKSLNNLDEAPQENPTINTNSTASRLFEEAMKIAPIPEQLENFKFKKHSKNKFKKTKQRKLSGLATSLSIVAILFVVGGFFIAHNLNRISLYLASSRAGFTPTVSGYSPSGFNLSSVSSASGIIESSFKSNSDARTYSIIEKKSNWNSNDLLNSYVLNKAGLNYQTIKTKGLNIFILNGNSIATWVNHGIWYIVQDNSLSTQQVIEIADTM